METIFILTTILIAAVSLTVVINLVVAEISFQLLKRRVRRRHKKEGWWK